MFLSRQTVLFLCASALTAAGWGCALFDGGLGTDGTAQLGQRTTLLRPVPRSRDALTVEVVFVERPVGDPLLGEPLWGKIDQIGAVQHDVRRLLEQNGIRVGVAAAQPPRALQTLLGLTPSFTKPDDKEAERLAGHRYVIPSGAQTEVRPSPLFESCTVAIEGAKGNQTKEYSLARFVFRVKAERLDEGWARLEFLPEIHHGEQRLRVAAPSTGFEYRTQQNIVPLYQQRFEVQLNLGEMVVITADGDAEQSLGRHFFLGTDPEAQIQRMVIVRLAEMSKIDPVRSQ